MHFNFIQVKLESSCESRKEKNHMHNKNKQNKLRVTHTNTPILVILLVLFPNFSAAANIYMTMARDTEILR